jgi:hypothetical protein
MHQIRRFLPDDFQGKLAVGGLKRLIAFHIEDFHQQDANSVLVIHNQNLLLVHCIPSLSCETTASSANKAINSNEWV